MSPHAPGGSAGTAPPGNLGAFPELEGYLDEERLRVEAALGRWCDSRLPSLPTKLAGAVRHGVAGGGKRLRPVLCVTAYRACGGASNEAIYDLAVSLELIHGYSLMHDDLPCMDDAELRRGLPATHRLFGEEATIVAGAAMIPLAALEALSAARALGLETHAAAAVVRELCQAAGGGGMVGGQALDLLAEGETLTAAALDRLHGLKTGALLTAALRMGGRAAGAPPEVLAGLDAYGRAVGLAFQIADDLLDATATAEALGKKPSDTSLGKSTYVSVHGLEAARARAVGLVGEACAALERVGLPADAPLSAPLYALAEYAVRRER